MTTTVSERFQNPENRRLFLIAASGAVVVAGFLVVALLATLPALAPIPALIGALLFQLLKRVFREPNVEVNGDGIWVNNPFSRTWVEWKDVAGFTAGRFLIIELKNGARIVAWAVQNPNIQFMTRREGYADEVAQRLSELQSTRG